MKIYFGKITDPEMLEMIGDEAYLYENEKYEFVLEASSEDVKIADSCGRYVPIGIDDWNSFMSAVIKADLHVAPIQKALIQMNLVNSDKECAL